MAKFDTSRAVAASAQGTWNTNYANTNAKASETPIQQNTVTNAITNSASNAYKNAVASANGKTVGTNISNNVGVNPSKTTTTPTKTNYLVNAQKGGVKTNTSNESWTNKALESTYGDTVIPDVKNASTTPVVDTKTRKVYLDENGVTRREDNNKAVVNLGSWFKNMGKGALQQRVSDFIATLANQNELGAYADKSSLALGLELTHDDNSKQQTNELTQSRITENEKIYDKAYEVRDTAQKNTAQAKANLGGGEVASAVTDIATVLTQVAADALITAATGIPSVGKAVMATSVYGSSVLNSKEDGANLAGQTANATANAVASYVLEGLFGGLTDAYGPGIADSAVGKFASYLTKNEKGVQFLTRLFKGGLEGVEEGVEDLLNTASKYLYGNDELKRLFTDENTRAEWIANTLYDVAIGAVVGGIGQSFEAFQEYSNKQSENAIIRAAEQQEWDNRLKATMEQQSANDQRVIDDIKAKENFNQQFEQQRANDNRIISQINESKARLDNLIATEGATKAASTIANDVRLLNDFKLAYPDVDLNVSSKTQLIKNIAEKVHKLSAGVDESLRPTPTNELTRAERKSMQDAMQIREMQKSGMTFAKANEIISNPVLKHTFEQMYGIKLSDSTNVAKRQIIELTNSNASQFNLVVDNPLVKNEQTNTPQENVTNNSPISTDTATNTNSQPNVKNSAEAVKPGVSSKSEQTTQNTEQTVKEEPPIADYNVARNTEEGMKEYPPKERERNGSRYSKEDKALAPEIRKSYEDDPDTYSVKHNKETLRNALDKIDNLGVDGATADLLQRIGAAENDGVIKTALGKGSITADDVPMAKVLANELNKQGRTAEARELLSSMFAEATRAGQFIQAFSLLRNVDSPMVARMAIDKMLEKTNNKIAKQYKKSTYRAELTAEEEARLENLDYSNEEEFRDFVSDLSKRIGREMPRSFGEVFNEWRRIGMLSRPATHIGNFVANIPTAMMQRMNNFFDGAIQDIGAATKVELVGDEVPVYNEAENEWRCAVGEQIIRADTKRRCTFLAKAAKFGKSGTAFFSQKSYNLADSVYSQYKDTMSGKSNKWDRQQKGGLGFEDKTVFRGKALDRICGMLEASGMDLSKFKNGDVYDPSLLQTIGNGIYEMMELEDSLFVRNAFNTSLASYCEAHGITDANNIPKSAIESAMADAFYYTYKNSNVLSDMINELKSIPGVGVLVGTKIPFSTTPTNIGIMAVEHNPIIAAGKGVVELANGEKTKARQSFSKALTGTAIIGIGALLRGLGVLSSADDDDKDKVNFLKSIGQRGNALLGKYDLSQLEPAISLISFGAALKDTWDSGEAMSAESIVLDAVSKSLESVFEMDMVQNLAELFNGSENKYSKSGATQFIESLLLDIPPQVIPGFYQAIVNSVDPVNRYSYDTEGFKENLIAGLKYYSGIGRNTLAEKADAKGNTSKGDKTTNAIDEILYPGKIAQGKADATDEYLMNLEETTGKKTMYPDTFSAGAKYKNAEGEEITVGVNETAKFQKTYSDTYLDAVNSLKDEKWFKALDGDEQLKIVSKYKSYAKDIAIAEAFKDQGKEYTSDTQTLVNGDEENGIPALGDKVFEYTAYKTMFDDSVKNEDYSTIDSFVSTFDDLDKTIKDVLFAKDSDIRSVVNAADDGVNATDYYSYKAQLKGAAEELNASTTGSNTKLLALSRAGLDTDTLEKVISNNTFGLSTTALAVVSVLCQPPYNYSLEDASNFLYEADYTINQKYETNDIIDMGLKSSNQATRILAKQLDNKTLEKTDENIEALRGALVAEDAKLSGIDGGNSNGSLTNLEVANWLSKSGLNRKDAESIYYALRKELSNYYNDWGSYTYQSEVAYLPKATNKGWTYGREKQTETKTEEPTNYISNNALYRSAQKAKTGW